MSDKIQLKDDEPRKVVLRIYGQIIQESPDTVLTDSVMFALLAEKTMGPKLYGVFTGGRVEEYVPVKVNSPSTVLQFLYFFYRRIFFYLTELISIA